MTDWLVYRDGRARFLISVTRSTLSNSAWLNICVFHSSVAHASNRKAYGTFSLKSIRLAASCGAVVCLFTCCARSLLAWELCNITTENWSLQYSLGPRFERCTRAYTIHTYRGIVNNGHRNTMEWSLVTIVNITDSVDHPTTLSPVFLHTLTVCQVCLPVYLSNNHHEQSCRVLDRRKCVASSKFVVQVKWLGRLWERHIDRLARKCGVIY